MFRLCPSPTMFNNNDRQDQARRLMQTGSSSVQKQRGNFRQEFINRLKRVRNSELDKLRQICEDKPDLDYKSIVELRAALQPDDELRRMLDSKQVLDFLEQVEADINEEEADFYERQMNDETEAIVNNLMNRCSACDVMIVQGTICEACSKEICSDF